MRVFTYEHLVHYYETDQMKVVHHSNYIRWMEEARTALLKEIGWPFDMLEKNGLISPVVDVACKYMKSMHYDDVVEVRTHITDFSGIRLCVAYEFYNKATGELCAKGNSSHCFIDPNGRPVIVKKIYPEFHELLVSLSKED